MSDIARAAQQALDWIEAEKVPQGAEGVAVLRAIRDALRQALAAPQAEPVAVVVESNPSAPVIEPLIPFGGWTLPVGTELFKHPAPAADAVRNAERYRFIRDADRSDCISHEISLYAMESLDEYVDAAMQGEAAMKGADHE